ncbi:FMN phosphatase YigB, HAD superfamily [Streptoalloteichus hindustanus]|uniref:FMN phosphatase YigB, HAD superfamily n=1 Tax=Streptoalloteichus hindustanus TaxID=2017 RepID=A0A1M5CPZ0_STRHI|nr:FMN phosphatase YigB, HAD superfamily [Streptoalloteichus hindustanus]
MVFDWRGTLVTTLDGGSWVREALLCLGRDSSDEAVDQVWRAVLEAAGEPDRLDAPGVDSDLALHRDTYCGVFADAGLDSELAGALYAVESDPAHNQFAVDVEPVLRSVSAHGCRIAVLSDIHFDLRPVFGAAGLADLVDVFVLSYEHGVQKPDPVIFRVALEGLGTCAGETLMVGDRASHDGAAVDVGMPVLLVPPLCDVAERRLHHVEALLGAPRRR